MAKWSKLKGALLFGTMLPVLGGGGFSCITDLLQDVLIGILFD